MSVRTVTRRRSIERYLTPSDLALLVGDMERGLLVWADRRIDADDPDGPRLAELARAFADRRTEVQIIYPARPRGAEGPAEPPEICLRDMAPAVLHWGVFLARWLAEAEAELEARGGA